MFKEFIYNILLFSGIIPGTYLMFVSLFGIGNILSTLPLLKNDIIILLAILMGIAGYIGLITALAIPKKIKLNFFLLLVGLTGFSLFISVEGGLRAWIWLLTIEEPDEWLIIAWPIITTILGLTVNFIQILNINKSKKETF